MSVGFKVVTLGGHKLILLLLPKFKKSPETPLSELQSRKGCEPL